MDRVGVCREEGMRAVVDAKISGTVRSRVDCRGTFHSSRIVTQSAISFCFAMLNGVRPFCETEQRRRASVKLKSASQDHMPLEATAYFVLRIEIGAGS